MIKIDINEGNLKDVKVEGTFPTLCAETVLMVKAVYDSIVSTIIVEDKNEHQAKLAGEIFIKTVMHTLPAAISFNSILEFLKTVEATDIKHADETPEDKENMSFSEFFKSLYGDKGDTK